MNDHITQGWEQFLSLCHRAASDGQQLAELFNLLFTLEEKESLAMRVLLIKELLKNEKTQREIAQHLDISIAKITRGSNCLKVASSTLKQFLLD